MAAKSKPDATPVDQLSFEAALKELEDIVGRLEQGEVDLEDSIALYERGQALKAHCEAKLKAAEGRLEKIVGAARASNPPTSADMGEKSPQSMVEPALAEAAGFVERTLDTLLPQADGPEARVLEAMRYAALGGGKRLARISCTANGTIVRRGSPRARPRRGGGRMRACILAGA